MVFKEGSLEPAPRDELMDSSPNALLCTVVIKYDQSYTANLQCVIVFSGRSVGWPRSQAVAVVKLALNYRAHANLDDSLGTEGGRFAGPPLYSGGCRRIVCVGA